MNKKDTPCLSEVLHDLISRHDQVTMADTIGIHSLALSCFKNGVGGMTIGNLEKLLSQADVIMIEQNRYKRVVNTIITLSELLKEAQGL